MADSLTFKCGKSVTKQTGSGMLLVRPKRGGDTHQVKRWWGLKHKAVYITAAVFKVTTDFGVVKLVIPTDRETTQLDIKHDGSGNFTFKNTRGVDRVAVYSEDFATFHREYQFAAISGGPTLTRTVAVYPSAPESVAFSGQAAISGTATVGQVLTATAPTFTGGVGTVTTNLIFQVSDTGSGGWTFLAGNPGTASGGTATYTLTSAEDGKYIRASYQVTDDEATHSSNSTGTGPVSQTFSTRVANADYSYVVTVVNTGTEEYPVNVYALNGTNQLAVSMSVGETAAFDFSGVASAHPLALFTDSTKATPVTVGVETGGTGNATLLFTPVVAATLSYQCINHANMGGDITVTS